MDVQSGDPVMIQKLFNFPSASCVLDIFARAKEVFLTLLLIVLLFLVRVECRAGRLGWLINISGTTIPRAQSGFRWSVAKDEG